MPAPGAGASKAGGTDTLPPQFLVIGHAVQDLLPGGNDDGWRLGGAAAYASVLARNLGLRTTVLTSTGPDVDPAGALPGIEVVSVLAERSTQFRNVYEGGHRRQYLPSRASPLRPEHLPERWRSAAIVLLGPVAGEVDTSLAGCFPSALIGAGAQGWLRRTGADSAVVPVAPEDWDAGPVLEHARALFLSDEDLPAEAAPAALEAWSRTVETVAFTRGYDGADVCHKGEWRHINAFPAQAVDPTGAGDVFAAAFLVSLFETSDAWEATRFAACAASLAVEGQGIAAVPDRQQVEERLARFPAIIAS